MPAEAHHWVIATRRHVPTRRATIADVAREAGVNKGTVSRALRGIPGVGPSTRQRIIATADRLDLSASHVATTLAGGRSRTVGLVLPTLRSWYFSEFAAGASSVLAPGGYQVEPDQPRRRLRRPGPRVSNLPPAVRRAGGRTGS